MTRFIDEQRQTYGIGSICKVLPIAPSVYYAHRQRQNAPCAHVFDKFGPRISVCMGLKGAVRGKQLKTTRPDPARPCPEDLVHRQFHAAAPNQLWVSDFTYVSTRQGFVYIAFIIDVFARVIVGWRVSSSAETAFVLDALEQALATRNPVGSVTHHPDRGSQYISLRYTQRLAEAGLVASVGSVGDSYDNALAETINGLYKTELIYRQGPWK